ncbi:hypothetical protein FNV66_35650 [Streptomyces sp. S1D4-14]|nr:hypothetical protein FNV67_36635 [Streptomyces sp. S1D4-20]QDN70151.1 hypothetical protein FNV66_35650 [Streptomyces sp. S1D4-14]QDO52604.1 hypothetical protein FNV60_34135 [Streptomyces sp. RLB3-5]QDO62847.1 hypothetical protein FNV59_36390 [Streptomyces sp. RLB1-8]
MSRNLVAAGAGALLTATLGTLVTLGATSSSAPAGPSGVVLPSAGENSAEPVTITESYQWVSEPDHFSLYVPRAFERHEDGEYVVYTSKYKTQQIKVKATETGGRTPLGEVKSAEELASSNPGYERILERSDKASGAWAELQYYSEGTPGDLRHTAVRWVLGPDGKMYSVLVTSPERIWPDSDRIFKVAVDSLCVSGYTCPDDSP